MQIQTDSVAVKNSRFGKGIFATSDLPKHTILFTITGDPLNFQDTLSLGHNECYCLQTDIDKYIIPHFPFNFSNHSCEPNCGITENFEFITLRFIEKGGELLWDYSTSMLEKHWIMNCKCGSDNCRQIIRDFDLIPPETQERYLQLGIVLPFIIKQLFSVQKIEALRHSA